MENISEILLNALSADVTVRMQAEETLSKLEKQTYLDYLQGLALELANETKPVGSRMFAGILFKNSLDLRWFVAPGIKYRDYSERYASPSISDTQNLELFKDEVRPILLNTLSSTVSGARRIAALATAKMIAVEVASSRMIEWPAYCQGLLSIMNPNSKKESILIALQTAKDFLYEVRSFEETETGLEVRVEQLKHMNVILVQLIGPSLDHLLFDIRFAGASFLYEAMDFFEKFFRDPGKERDQFLSKLFLAAGAEDKKIAHIILTCLSWIVFEFLGASDAKSYYGRLLSMLDSRDTADRVSQYREQTFGQYLQMLTCKLGYEEELLDSRILAGSQLLISLDNKEEWLGMDLGSKMRIKEMLFRILVSEVCAITRIATLAITRVAAMELPRQEWPGFIGELVVVSPDWYKARITVILLQTLAHVLDEIGPTDLSLEDMRVVLFQLVLSGLEDKPEVSRGAAMVLYKAIQLDHRFFMEPGTERNGFVSKLFSQAREEGNPDAETRQLILKSLNLIAFKNFDAFATQRYSDRILLILDVLSAEEECVVVEGIRITELISVIEYWGRGNVVNPLGFFSARGYAEISQALRSILENRFEWDVGRHVNRCLRSIERTAMAAFLQAMVPVLSRFFGI